MADLSKIRKNGVDYDIKDATARAAIEELKQNGTGGGTTTETVTETGNMVKLIASAGAEINVSGETAEVVTLVHHGKNFLSTNELKSFVANGLTVTRNDDGTFHVKGTSTAVTFINITKDYLPAGMFLLSANVSDKVREVTLEAKDGSGRNFQMLINQGNLTRTVRPTTGYQYIAYVVIQNGVTIDETISVHIEEGMLLEDLSGYEPYCGESIDGTLPMSVTAYGGVNYVYTKGDDVLTATMTTEVKDIEDERFDATDYGMPVLTLDGNCTGMTKDDYVSLAYTFQGKSGTVDVKKQGSSSITTGIEIGAKFDTDLGGLFNFTLKFPEAFEAKTGWGAQKKYCVKVNAIDHSHCRNVCSCKLWGQMVKSRANVPTELANLPNGGAIDGFPIVIVLNGKFYALGTFNIPKDGWMFGNPKAVLSAETHCDPTRFKALATMSGDFEIEYAEDEDNTDWILPSLNTAIQSVMNSNGSDLDTVVGQYIDIPSAIDYYIHCVDESADDGVSKNYLLVTYDGIKWYFSAYDRDTTYGLHWQGKTIDYFVRGIDFAIFASQHQLMYLLFYNKLAELKARAIALRDGVKSEINVANVFTKFAADIPAAIYDQNCKRWPLLRSTSVSNVAQILNWYRLRRAFLDKQIDAWNV